MEGLSVIDRIYKHNAGCSFIIRLSHSLEPLLPCCVPNLHLDLDIINIDSLDLKINPNRGNMRNLVLFIRIPQQNIGLADSRVTDDDDFNEVVVFLLLATFGHA